ncbi:MAG: hypothetical protein JSU66_12380 [Deltaproteobacteria bacterium]|nr:MAG: hypothetical protein JSU66_12380 [Deltaproteobacteria bacterium]
MSKLWIVHRTPTRRHALARLVGRTGEPEPELGGAAPEDFESKAPPSAVVLGVEGDFDLELHFADRVARAHPDARWIIAGSAVDLPEARRLFAGLAADFVRVPSERAALRRAVGSALERRSVDTLLDRGLRRVVWERFDRWFEDLTDRMPDLLRAADPAREGVPILLRGEPGTGRGLLARYVHHHDLRDPSRSGSAPGRVSFVRIGCAGMRTERLLERLSPRLGALPACAKLTICLEDVDRADLDAQHELRDWIETGPPDRLLGVATRLRWIGLASDAFGRVPEPDLDPGLEQSLGALLIRIPPLRERADFIPRFVEQTALAWCNARGLRRRFTSPAIDVLLQEPWPGNLRELESVVLRTLATSDALEIGPEDLRLEDGGPLWAPEAQAEPRVRASEPPPTPPVEPSGDVGAEPERSETGAPDAPPAAPTALAADEVKRFITSIEHEVRNPLVSIATLVKLLQERYDDPEFRERFGRVVDSDVQRIERVMDRLSRLSTLRPPERKPFDVSAFIEELLERQRERIERRRLVVLEELDQRDGVCLGDEAQLRFALEALLEKSLELVPDRGDVYVAARHHPEGLRGGPSLRVLIRFQSPESGAGGGVPSASEMALDVLVAEAIVRAAGGFLTVSDGGGRETLIVLDLPAPPRH